MPPHRFTRFTSRFDQPGALERETYIEGESFMHFLDRGASYDAFIATRLIGDGPAFVGGALALPQLPFEFEYQGSRGRRLTEPLEVDDDALSAWDLPQDIYTQEV